MIWPDYQIQTVFFSLFMTSFPQTGYKIGGGMNGEWWFVKVWKSLDSVVRIAGVPVEIHTWHLPNTTVLPLKQTVRSKRVVDDKGYYDNDVDYSSLQISAGLWFVNRLLKWLGYSSVHRSWWGDSRYQSHKMTVKWGRCN